MFVQVIEGRLRDGESRALHLATWTSDVASRGEGSMGSTAGVTADVRRSVDETGEALQGIPADVVGRPSDRTFVPVVPVAVPLGASGILVAVGPDLVRGTLRSTESVLRVGAVVAGWVLFSRLMRRVVPNPRVRTGVKAVAGAWLLWLNVAPYFKHDVKIAGGFPESFTTAGASTASSDAGTSTPGELHPTTSAQPVQVTSGRLRGLAGHRGSGEASVFRQPDGSYVVAFRDLSVSSVPDPVLYLVPGPDQERLEGATRLGRFDPGRDSYQIPAGADLSAALTVLIWCQRFAVPVAGATQAPV